MGNVWRAPRPGKRQGMRVMFSAWLFLIGTGLVYFTVIGLTHH
jgi:hypothetical protein